MHYERKRWKQSFSDQLMCKQRSISFLQMNLLPEAEDNLLTVDSEIRTQPRASPIAKGLQPKLALLHRSDSINTGYPREGS